MARSRAYPDSNIHGRVGLVLPENQKRRDWHVRAPESFSHRGSRSYTIAEAPADHRLHHLSDNRCRTPVRSARPATAATTCVMLEYIRTIRLGGLDPQASDREW